MARPTKLSDETLRKITNALRAGNYIETAARYAGIASSTLYEWLDRGERGERGYVEFYEQVELARAEAEVSDVAHLRIAGKTNWQAYAWMLERRHPTRWGRRPPAAAGPEQNLTVKLVWPEQAAEPEENR